MPMSAFFSTSPTAATTSSAPTAATIAGRRPNLLRAADDEASLAAGASFDACADSDIVPCLQPTVCSPWLAYPRDNEAQRNSRGNLPKFQQTPWDRAHGTVNSRALPIHMFYA